MFQMTYYQYFDDLKVYFDDDALVSANTIIAEKKRLVESYGSINKVCIVCEEPEIPYRKLTSCEKCKVHQTERRRRTYVSWAFAQLHLRVAFELQHALGRLGNAQSRFERQLPD